MFDFLQVIAASVTSLFLLISSPFVAKTAVNPMPTPTPIIENLVRAAGTYSYQGYSVDVVIEFPQDGGVMKGIVDGDCKGTTEGNYIGGESQQLTGQATAQCQVALFKVDATADLSGNVSFDQKKVEVKFNGKAGEFTHSGSITLSIAD